MRHRLLPDAEDSTSAWKWKQALVPANGPQGSPQGRWENVKNLSASKCQEQLAEAEPGSQAGRVCSGSTIWGHACFGHGTRLWVARRAEHRTINAPILPPARHKHSIGRTSASNSGEVSFPRLRQTAVWPCDPQPAMPACFSFRTQLVCECEGTSLPPVDSVSSA